MHVPNHGANIIRINGCLNHWIEPNMRTNDGYNLVSLRKILVGEELTVNYRAYCADSRVATE